MTPSVDPVKVAERETLATQMAEWEAKHGPVKTMPITKSSDEGIEYSGGVSPEKQRRRGRKGLDSMGAK